MWVFGEWAELFVDVRQVGVVHGSARYPWNIRTKTQLLFKRFIWAILTNWWISDKAGPFWRQLPTPANALRPTYINQLLICTSLKVRMFVILILLLLLLLAMWKRVSVFLRRDKLCVCVEGSGRVFEKGQTMCLCLCGWGDCVFQKGNIYVSMSLRRDKLCVWLIERSCNYKSDWSSRSSFWGEESINQINWSVGRSVGAIKRHKRSFDLENLINGSHWYITSIRYLLQNYILCTDLVTSSHW